MVGAELLSSWFAWLSFGGDGGNRIGVPAFRLVLRNTESLGFMRAFAIAYYATFHFMPLGCGKTKTK
jgi:hypothetical protein